MKQNLLDRFADRSAKIAVFGLDYVGLPLAVCFAEAGFRVTGIDPDEDKEFIKILFLKIFQQQYNVLLWY